MGEVRFHVERMRRLGRLAADVAALFWIVTEDTALLLRAKIRHVFHVKQRRREAAPPFPLVDRDTLYKS